jgi:putative transcriptional regulator
MVIRHHPALENLMTCSAGSMPEAVAAVMASHIEMCPSCRSELAIMQQIGTALFEAIVPAPVARAAPVVAMRSLESESGDELQTRSDGQVPTPLVKCLGKTLDSVRWKRVGPGVWQHQIALSHAGRGSLRLIKVAPGRSLPERGHSGSELTLVLRGSFHDAYGRYIVGDVADVDETIDHAPIADAAEGCICLVATEGKMLFKSPIARLAQRLIGF